MSVEVIGTPSVQKKQLTHADHVQSFSYSHPSGDNTGIWIQIDMNTANTNELPFNIASITLDGSAMTKSTFLNGPNPPIFGKDGSYNVVEWWWSPHKPAGSYPIVITYDDPDTVSPYSFFVETIACVFSVKEMNQTSPRRGVFSNAGGHLDTPDQTKAFIDIDDSLTGDLCVIGKSARQNGPHTLGSGQSAIFADTQGLFGGQVKGAASSKPGATGTTVHLEYINGTSSDSEWIALGFAIAMRPQQVTTSPSLTFLGADITSRVLDWSSIEQIKEVNLSVAQLFTAEHTLKLRNEDGAFDPVGPKSLIRGIRWYNSILNISNDPHKVVIAGSEDSLIYQGYIKDVVPHDSDGTVDIKSENIFKKPAESRFVGSGSGMNPALVALAAVRTVLKDTMIDVTSFHAAGGPSKKAGATINYTIEEGDNETIMSFLQKISELCSISFWVRFNRMYARAFIPYGGNQSGLKARLDSSIVREWGDWKYDISSFNNIISVGYPTDQYVERKDDRSIQITSIERKITYAADAKVVASNRASATFFAVNNIERSGYRKALINLACGPEMKNAILGDRHPIYNPGKGWNDIPAEIIEVHPNLDTNDIILLLAQLKEKGT